MKKILLLVSLFVSFTILDAQVTSNSDTLRAPDGTPIIKTSDTTVIFDIVEQMPEFTGGEKALNNFFAKNLTYPNLAKEKGIQGKVWLSFIVNKDGSLTDVQVIRGIGGGCDEESVRVIKLMPNWIPGKQSGHIVRVRFKFPINFTLK